MPKSSSTAMARPGPRPDSPSRSRSRSRSSRSGDMTPDAASAERQPLLGPASIGPASGPARPGPTAGAPDALRRRVLAAALAMVLLVDFAGFFLDAPQTSILEAIICRRHYGAAPASPRDCAARAVQAELATVNQLLATFGRLPGLVVALPFGALADRRGRRPVLVLAIVGALLQDAVAKAVLWRPDVFPPRFIWLSAVAGFVGGGDAVAGAVMFLIVADVAPPSRRASLFFLLTACGLVAEVVATPLCALLMAWNPWIPYFVYTVLTFIGGVVPLFFLPETLPRSSPEGETPPASAAEGRSSRPSALSRLRPLFKPNVVAVLLAFFVSSLGRQSTGFLLQYIRQRFDWKYEKASLLMTLRAVVNLALLVIGLPALNSVLARRKMSSPAKDLLISRFSLAFFALGSLVISAAPVVPLAAVGIVTFALGSGFSPAARSLVTSFCHQHQAGLLYSALAITQSVGGLVAGPVLALSFRWGLGLGHEWTGIPFALVAALFGCSFLALSFVRL